MHSEHIKSIEYSSKTEYIKEICILFSNSVLELRGHRCEKVLVEWNVDFCKTTVLVSDEEELLYEVQLWGEVCPNKALAYVCNNIKYY